MGGKSPRESEDVEMDVNLGGDLCTEGKISCTYGLAHVDPKLDLDG